MKVTEKNIVYPAVLYRDPETGGFTIAIHDLGIVTEGETVEKAYLNCKDYLTTMCECAIRFDCEIEPPSNYIDICKKFKDNLVILVDTQII